MSALKTIAKKMRQQAEKNGQHQYPLKRGLVLTLQIGPATESLSMTRENVFPSPKEEEIIRAAFDIPTNAAKSRFEKAQWRVIRLTWVKEEAKKVEAVQGVLL